MSKLIFQVPATLRPLLYTTHRHATTDSLPRVAQPSTWTSMIPKAFRRHPNAPAEPARTSKWKWFMSHPATPVLALSLLVGSQAINTLALKNEMLAYTRATEGKLALLKGVIERVQKGEEFDVDEVLGTGKVTEEGEWFDASEKLLPTRSGFDVAKNFRLVKSLRGFRFTSDFLAQLPRTRDMNIPIHYRVAIRNRPSRLVFQNKEDVGQKICDPDLRNQTAIEMRICANLSHEHKLTSIPVIKEIEAEERTQSRNERRREKQRKMAEEEEAASKSRGETANANPQAEAKPMFM